MDFNLGIVVLCILILAVIGTYVKKLLKDNKNKDVKIMSLLEENQTKEISIIGLKEIIRLLEKKRK